MSTITAASAIQRGAAGSATETTPTSVTIPTSSELQVGAVLIAVVYSGDFSTVGFTRPPGWVLQGQSGGAGFLAIYSRQVTANEPTSHTFTYQGDGTGGPGTKYLDGVILQYTGANFPVTLRDPQFTYGFTTGTAPASVAQTTTANESAGDLPLVLFGSFAGSTFSIPPNTVLRAYAVNDGSESVYAFEAPASVAGGQTGPVAASNVAGPFVSNTGRNTQYISVVAPIIPAGVVATSGSGAALDSDRPSIAGSGVTPRAAGGQSVNRDVPAVVVTVPPAAASLKGQDADRPNIKTAVGNAPQGGFTGSSRDVPGVSGTQPGPTRTLAALDRDAAGLTATPNGSTSGFTASNRDVPTATAAPGRTGSGSGLDRDTPALGGLQRPGGSGQSGERDLPGLVASGSRPLAAAGLDRDAPALTGSSPRVAVLAAADRDAPGLTFAPPSSQTATALDRDVPGVATTRGPTGILGARDSDRPGAAASSQPVGVAAARDSDQPAVTVVAPPARALAALDRDQPAALPTGSGRATASGRDRDVPGLTVGFQPGGRGGSTERDRPAASGTGSRVAAGASAERDLPNLTAGRNPLVVAASVERDVTGGGALTLGPRVPAAARDTDVPALRAAGPALAVGAGRDADRPALGGRAQDPVRGQAAERDVARAVGTVPYAVCAAVEHDVINSVVHRLVVFGGTVHDLQRGGRVYVGQSYIGGRPGAALHSRGRAAGRASGGGRVVGPYDRPHAGTVHVADGTVRP